MNVTNVKLTKRTDVYNATVNGTLIKGIHSQSREYSAVIDWLAIEGNDAETEFSQEELDQKALDDKWNTFETFKNTLQVTTDSNCILLANEKNIAIWIYKTNGKDPTALEAKWIEDWDTYLNVPMSDFAEAIRLANKAIDDKFTELFGAV